MYSLKDNGIVQELDFGNNFAYVLNDNSRFIMTDYKVLLSQTNDMFVQCMKTLYNGHIEMFYITDDYRPMSTMFAGITSEMLITIASNLFAAIMEVRNNGFLSSQNIDVSWDKIFVNANTLKVKLVYIPVNYKVFDSYSEFESELRSSLIKLINNVIDESNPRMDQFLIDLSNGSLNLKDLYNRTKGEGTTDVLADNKNSNSHFENINVERVNTDESGALKLVALDSPEHFEIILNRNMIIGKKKSLADEVIPYNGMISRKHCQIIIEGNNYYIMDIGSLNGVKINDGPRINVGVKTQIKRGDLVTLANSKFKVV